MTQPPLTPYEPPWWNDDISLPHAPLWVITSNMMADVRSSIEYDYGREGFHTVYVAIGNSDNKLTQAEWAEFVKDTRAALDHYGERTYGVWFSAADVPWQNACICKEVSQREVLKLRAALREIRKHYRQDSVAFVVIDTTELL